MEWGFGKGRGEQGWAGQRGVKFNFWGAVIVAGRGEQAWLVNGGGGLGVGGGGEGRARGGWSGGVKWGFRGDCRDGGGQGGCKARTWSETQAESLALGGGTTLKNGRGDEGTEEVFGNNGRGR